jgi:hypothetical protein
VHFGRNHLAKEIVSPEYGNMQHGLKEPQEYPGPDAHEEHQVIPQNRARLACGRHRAPPQQVDVALASSTRRSATINQARNQLEHIDRTQAVHAISWYDCPIRVEDDQGRFEERQPGPREELRSLTRRNAVSWAPARGIANTSEQMGNERPMQATANAPGRPADLEGDNT